MTKLNTGLSGCSLELINDRVLRKYSPTTDYNSRLLSQADKQVVFGNRIYKYIDAPKVYDMNASIYIWRRNFLLKSNNIFTSKTSLFIMPPERSCDIDNKLDFHIFSDIHIAYTPAKT